uniref:Uncharacterized protein n=1 Tax=Rhizophagus irregularis (strain DAOM 181602 / DAOM 197198 / MUCL 43194) TaxID=747089 RepID=U9UAT6_RHIID
MIDFDEKELILANPILANSMIDFDQRYKKKEMPHSDKNGRRRLLRAISNRHLLNFC